MTAARLARLFAGFATLATGITLTLRSELGVGPWDVLHQGLDRRTPLSFGLAAVVVGLVVFLTWIPLRLRPGVGSVLGVATVGPLTDLGLRLIGAPTGLPGRIGFLLLGTALLGVGVGTYLAAELGAGPQDGVMVGLADRGLPLRWVRTVMELSALAVGWLLGGTVGVGTLLIAVTIGHTIDLTLRWHRRRDARRPPRRRGRRPGRAEPIAQPA